MMTNWKEKAEKIASSIKDFADDLEGVNRTLASEKQQLALENETLRADLTTKDNKIALLTERVAKGEHKIKCLLDEKHHLILQQQRSGGGMNHDVVAENKQLLAENQHLQSLVEDLRREALRGSS